MRILVTGINGQLGYDVFKVLKEKNYDVIGVGRDTMDLQESIQIKECIDKINPNVIVHCAAYTSVDDAEDDEELCRRINAYAVRDIAEKAKELDAVMIYISTDYIFDGEKILSEKHDNTNNEVDYYLEYVEEDKPNPQNVYGKTKLEGEQYVKELLDKYYILRISWVFGENGKNFIDTMIKLSKQKEEISVIGNQIGSPTYTKDLANVIVEMIETNKYGVYHVTNDGFCSWYEFSKEIFRITESDILVKSINSSEYCTKAKRPLNSKMSKQKLAENGFTLPRKWQDALLDYISNTLKK